MSNRVSQLPIEVLVQSSTGVALRVSQAPVEILVSDAPVVPDVIAHLDQLPVEVALLSDAVIDLRLDQLPVEVLVFTVEPGWRLTIDGVNRTAIVDAATFTFTLNERARASITLADFIPPKGAEVISYAKDGYTPIFGGLILTRAFSGRNQYDPTFTVTIECGDFFTVTDWTSATLSYVAEVTLKAVLQDLIENYLGAYGVVLDPRQSDGPTLAPFNWSNKRISDAIRDLSDRTGYVARMGPFKTLRMLFPGTEAAPFAITEAAPHSQELSWRDNDSVTTIPVNTVRVICGPTGIHQIGGYEEGVAERHYGDGVNRIFVLDAPFVAVIGAVDRSDEPGGYPLALYNVELWPDGQNFPYSYDPAINAIRQRDDQPVVPVGEWIGISYMAQFPFTVTATSIVGSPAPPIVEHVETRVDVLSRPVGQEIADGLLAQLGGGSSGEPPVTLTMGTDEDGLEVGQALTVDLPVTRSVSGEFIVTNIGLTIVQDTGPTDEYWQYAVEADDGDLYQGSYLNQWRKLTGTSGDAAPPSLGPPTGGVGAVMKSPAFLGGSRGVSIAVSPASWQPVINYVTFTAPATLLARVRVDLFALNPGVTAQARLYNLTDGAAVATSSVVTSTAAVSVSFGADVTIAKSYRLEVIAGTAAEGVFAIGTIEAA